MRLPTALVSSAAAGALTLTVSGCSSSSSTPAMDHNATPMPGMSATTSMSAALAGRAGDVMFAQMMIPHHQQAIELADIALGKPSASAMVRELATQIKAAQDPEITLMRGWLTSWGASTATAGGMGQGMGSGMMGDTDLTALRAAQGAEFDRRWLTGMIAHHQGAVLMANQVLASTTDPAVKALAESIVNTQTAEITTMQAQL